MIENSSTNQVTGFMIVYYSINLYSLFSEDKSVLCPVFHHHYDIAISFIKFKWGAIINDHYFISKSNSKVFMLYLRVAELKKDDRRTFEETELLTNCLSKSFKPCTPPPFFPSVLYGCLQISVSQLPFHRSWFFVFLQPWKKWNTSYCFLMRSIKLYFSDEGYFSG